MHDALQLPESLTRSRAQSRDHRWFGCPSTSTRSRRCATRAAGASRACSTRWTSASTPASPGITVHPRADGATSRRTTCATIARAARGAAAGRRVQHRRRSAAGLLDLVAGGPAGPVHAGAGRARRDHQPGGMAAGAGDRAAAGRDRGLASRAASASACSSMPTPDAIRLGGVGRRRSGRALHRAVRARLRARPRRRAARRSRTYADAARAGALARARRQRRPRSRSRQPGDLPRSAASRRSVDRPRHHVARALRRASTVVREYLAVLAGRSDGDYDQLTSAVGRRLSAA